MQYTGAFYQKRQLLPAATRDELANRFKSNEVFIRPRDVSEIDSAVEIFVIDVSCNAEAAIDAANAAAIAAEEREAALFELYATEKIELIAQIDEKDRALASFSSRATTRVNAITEDNMALTDQISRVEAENADLKRRVDGLIAENANLTGRVESLTARVDDLRAETAVLTGRVAAVKAANVALVRHANL